jgi:hypothetical protein
VTAHSAGKACFCLVGGCPCIAWTAEPEGAAPDEKPRSFQRGDRVVSSTGRDFGIATVLFVKDDYVTVQVDGYECSDLFRSSALALHSAAIDDDTARVWDDADAYPAPNAPPDVPQGADLDLAREWVREQVLEWDAFALAFRAHMETPEYRADPEIARQELARQGALADSLRALGALVPLQHELVTQRQMLDQQAIAIERLTSERDEALAVIDAIQCNTICRQWDGSNKWFAYAPRVRRQFEGDTPLAAYRAARTAEQEASEPPNDAR